MRVRLLVVSLTVLSAATAVALRPAPEPAVTAPRASRPLPPPTEHWLDESAEADNKTRRKAWMKERHRAGPDVDWVSVERANGKALVEKRRGAPPPGPSPWVERGSSNQAGRMHVGRPSPDGSTLYAGSALGGVWKGDVDGGGWTPIADDLYGGAHWLAVLPPDVPGDPDVVLAGTDWGWLNRTTDDGGTWAAPEGWPSASELRRLIVDGDGVVWAVTGASGAYTLSRSLDKGATFAAVRDLGDDAGDLWTPRTGPGPLYLLDGDEVLVSEDGGGTWATRGTIGAGASNGLLVGSEAGAPTLYAAVYRGGWVLFRSDDAGMSWNEQGAMADFWGAFDASSLDPARVAWGGVELYLSEDGGASAAKVNDWWTYYDDPATQLHADIMGVDAVPDAQGGEVWYVATDGGLYRSADGLATVESLSLTGLRVSQYYSTLTSAANPEHVAAGAQDQGYQVTQGVTQDDDLLEFDQVLSGDYGHLTSSDGTHAWVYSVYPGFVLVAQGEDQVSLEYLDFPSGESYAWLPPVLADPEDQQTFFFGASHLYRYTRARRQWSSEVWSEQDFARGQYEYISAIAVSPLDASRMWVATNYGRLFYSTDKGVTWTRSDDAGPEGNYFYGTALVASKVDADTVYVGGSGYSGPAVYRSTDGGERWEAYGDGLPATLVYSLAEASDGVLVAGTETAPYRRAPGDAAWTDISEGVAPVTIWWSAEALPDGSGFRFGTYGRGMWDYLLPAGEPEPDDSGADDSAQDSPAGDVPGGEDVEVGAGDCGCGTGLGGGWWAVAVAAGLARRRWGRRPGGYFPSRC